MQWLAQRRDERQWSCASFGVVSLVLGVVGVAFVLTGAVALKAPSDGRERVGPLS